MRALTFRGDRGLRLEHKDDLEPAGPTDVVVDVHYCGICGTDLGILAGEYPAVRLGVTMGHEASGVVAAVGTQVRDLAVGDRVVVDPTPTCGECRFCRTDRGNHCRHKDGTEAGVSADGAFADRFRTTRQHVHRLPDHLSLRAAALVEPLSCVLGGVRQLDLRYPSDRSVVVGAGPLGLLYAWALTLRGVHPMVVETATGRRRAAVGRLPVSVSVHETVDDALAARFGTDPDADTGLDLVVDTTSRLLEPLLPRMAAGGTFLQVGLRVRPATVDASLLADRSLKVLGSIDSRGGSFLEALALIGSGHVPAERLVSHVVALEDFADAFALLGQDVGSGRSWDLHEDAGKVLVAVHGSTDAPASS